MSYDPIDTLTGFFNCLPLCQDEEQEFFLEHCFVVEKGGRTVELRYSRYPSDQQQSVTVTLLAGGELFVQVGFEVEHLKEDVRDGKKCLVFQISNEQALVIWIEPSIVLKTIRL